MNDALTRPPTDSESGQAGTLSLASLPLRKGEGIAAGPRQDASRQLVPRLLAWFRANARDLPWRRTRDPYAIWVSEIMLQQTQVKTVIPYWERWRREWPGVGDLAAAAPDRVLKLWEGLGYYRRARNLHQAARVIVESHGGRFPREFAAVLALPGIGRYTAGAICSIAFNQPVPVLDGNVTRVLTRLFAWKGDPKARALNARLWQMASTLVTEAAADRADDNACSHCNQALMELGATVCTPAKPDCGACPLAKLCRAHAAGRETAFPQSARRPSVTARRFATALLANRGRWLVHRRPSDVVNGGFWEFPSVELGRDAEAGAVLSRWLKLPPDSLKSAGQLRHTITRYRLTQEVFRASARSRRFAMLRTPRWVTRAELDQLHLTGSHRKLARAL